MVEIEEEEPYEELNCYGWWVRWKDGGACTGGNYEPFPDGGSRSENFVKFLNNAKRNDEGNKESDGNNIGFPIGRKVGDRGKV